MKLNDTIVLRVEDEADNVQRFETNDSVDIDIENQLDITDVNLSYLANESEAMVEVEEGAAYISNDVLTPLVSNESEAMVEVEEGAAYIPNDILTPLVANESEAMVEVEEGAVDISDDILTPLVANESEAMVEVEVEEGAVDISDDILTPLVALQPYVGLQYRSCDEAYDMYNLYGKERGFGIRRHTVYTSTRTRVVTGRIFVCSKQGLKIYDSSKVKSHEKRERRTNCTARMSIRLNQETSIWTVTIFNDEHNHSLSTPSQKGKHRSHQTFHKSAYVQNLMVGLHEGGFRPTSISKVVNLHGRDEDELVTAQQCLDQLRTKRKSNIGKECLAIVKHFQKKKKTDPLFFYEMDIDDDDQTLKSVLWADGRSINSCLEFGDVVVFDVTYRTNKFSLPFAPFTGVNHHGQSTLFGCALLSDEKETTFEWLFKQWMHCMRGKAPKVIITDQDPAICSAIKTVFPATRHRYCSWHVDKHLTEHLDLLISKDDKFNNDYNEWFQCDSISESERLWKSLVDKYELHSNKWLMKMHEKRHHWVPVYWKDIFTAGMKSSQRSESINAFFDGYVHAMTPLDEFVTQYDKALVSRRKAEKDEDFNTMDSNPRYHTELGIERQAAKLYTRMLYARFQDEFIASFSYWKEKVCKNEGTTKYIVGKSTMPTNMWKTVVYTVSDDLSFTCSCAKFEIEGILCRHILCIMRFKMVDAIPEKYILKRWTMNARFKMDTAGGMSSDLSNCSDITPLMLYSLKCKINKVFECASSSLAMYKKFDTLLDGELAEVMVQNRTSEQSIDFVSSTQVLENKPYVLVHDPSGAVKTKGRPRLPSRFQSGREVGYQEKAKEQRACSNCQGRGHNRTTCPKRKKLDSSLEEM